MPVVRSVAILAVLLAPHIAAAGVWVNSVTRRQPVQSIPIKQEGQDGLLGRRSALEGTGWDVYIYGGFNNHVELEYLDNDPCSGDIRIRLIKQFHSRIFDSERQGRAVYLKFVLRDKHAEKYSPNFTIVSETITNNTDMPWESFHLKLIEGFFRDRSSTICFEAEQNLLQAAGPFPHVDVGCPQEIPSLACAGAPKTIDLLNGVLPSDSTFQIGGEDQTIRMVTNMREGQRFWLKEWPSAIPEPATALLLTAGAIPLVWPRKKTVC